MIRLMVALTLLLLPVWAEAVTYTVTANASCTTLNGKPTGLAGAGLPSNDLANLAAGDILQLNAGVVLTRCMMTASGTTASPITLKSSSAASCPALADARPTATEWANMGAFAPVADTASSGNQTPALEFDNGVHDYLVKCLEFKREASPLSLYSFFPLICVSYSPCGSGSSRVHWTSITEQQKNITFNQIYLHGQPYDHTRQGMYVDGKNIVVKNSVLMDIHASNTEGQVILCSWCSYSRFINNTIEGGSIGIYFGGNVEGNAGSDWEWNNAHHNEIVKNNLDFPVKYNPNNAAYVPTVWETTIASITTTGTTNTVVKLAGPTATGYAVGNAGTYFLLSGCNISAMNGYWTITSQNFGSACGAACAVTFPNMNSSGFGTYTANSCKVNEAYNNKNRIECKNCEDLVVDGNTWQHAWASGAASGGGQQGGGFTLNLFADATVGLLGRGDLVSAVDCATGSGGHLTVTTNSATAGLWLNGRINLSGVTLSATPTGWLGGNTNYPSGRYDYNVPSPGSTTNPVVSLLDVGVVGGCTATLRNVTITGATNASPIVITAAGHGMSTGDYTCITGVGGNTNANGCWQVTVVDANTLQLTLGLLSTETTGGTGATDKTAHVSTGNSAYTTGGALKPALWNTQDRGPGHVMQRIRVSNNICKHTYYSCFSINHAFDHYVQPPAFRLRINNIALINNYFEDVDYRSSSKSINCGWPSDDGNTECGSGNTGSGLVLGFNQYGADNYAILHTTYYPNNDQTLNTLGTVMSFDSLGTAFDEDRGTNYTFKYNIMPSQLSGFLNGTSADCAFRDAALFVSNCMAGTLTAGPNVLVAWTGAGTASCSGLNSANASFNTNYWATDVSGQKCDGAETYIAYDTTGSGSANKVSFRSSTDFALLATSAYVKGGARQATASPLCKGSAGSMGVHWQRIRAAQGLVPDPNWAASC